MKAIYRGKAGKSLTVGESAKANKILEKYEFYMVIDLEKEDVEIVKRVKRRK